MSASLKVLAVLVNAAVVEITKCLLKDLATILLTGGAEGLSGVSWAMQPAGEGKAKDAVYLLAARFLESQFSEKGGYNGLPVKLIVDQAQMINPGHLFEFHFGEVPRDEAPTETFKAAHVLG